MVKTYACNTAIIISNPVNIITNISGAHPPNSPNKTIKEANTLSIVCPAIMLAKSLTDKLMGLLKYEIISMTVIIGSKTIGTPLGTNIFKYLKPCITKPSIVTPIKINIAKVKVTIMWLVTVKE